MTGWASCHGWQDWNGALTLQPEPVDSHPHYVAERSGVHLYYTSGYSSWVLDTDTQDSNGVSAAIASAANLPPVGTLNEWIEFCDVNGGVTASLTVQYQLSVSNCEALWAYSLETLECAAASTTQDKEECPVACAFTVLENRDLCHEAGHDAAFRSGFTDTCDTTAEAWFGAAPDSIELDGLMCHTTGTYLKQADLIDRCVL